MAFGVRGVRERNRRLRILDVVCRDVSRLFLPLLDHRRVANDIDLALVIWKAHPPAETALIEIAQLWLVGVVIRRAKQRPAEATPRDVRKITFEWFGLRDLDRVKIIARVREGGSFQNATIRSDGSIFA